MGIRGVLVVFHKSYLYIVLSTFVCGLNSNTYLQVYGTVLLQGYCKHVGLYVNM